MKFHGVGDSSTEPWSEDLDRQKNYRSGTQVILKHGVHMGQGGHSFYRADLMLAG